MTSTLELQRRLIALGYSVGNAGADGIFGRDTIAAITKFQIDARLDIKFPGTVGPKTLSALGLGTGEVLPPWVLEAKRKMGLHEVRDNAELKKYLKSDGHTLGDPAKLPWCGDFIETVIAVTLPNEPVITNPYWARNWLKFGVEIAKDQPVMGAIGIVERDGGGHVFIVVGQDKTHLHALGGNQSNSISIVRIEKKRLLGLRHPSTYEIPSLVLPFTVFSGQISTNEA